MKKTTRKAAVLGLAVGMMSMAMTAAAEENGGEDFADLFYTYSNDNIVMNYTVPEYLTPEGNLQLKYFNGFLMLQQIDLNWDGSRELLAVRIKSGTDDQGADENNIVAEVYQREGNTLQRKCQYTLAEQVLQSSTARIDIFTHDTSYGTIICCESKDMAAIGADGISWSMRAAAFDGVNLNELCNVLLTGSSFEQQEIQQAMEAMYAADLQPGAVIEQPVTDQIEGLISDYTITRSLTADSQTISDYINGVTNDGNPLEYGQTYFRNITGKGWDNKIPGEFFTIAGETYTSELGSEAAEMVDDDMQQLAGVLSYGADYVFPDSSQRYITAEELQGMSETEILLARNEIYAKHGYIFRNEMLNQYFNSKNWYIPNVEGSEFTEEYASRVFNDFELNNIWTIVQYEDQNGLNQFN